jgi:hypothetical protein
MSGMVGELGRGELRLGEDAFNPDLAVGIAEPDPRHPQRSDEKEHGVCVALGPRPLQSGAEVLSIGERTPEVVRSERHAPPCFNTGDEGVAVPPPREGILAGLYQLLGSVLPDRLKQPVTRCSSLAVHDDK